MNISDRAARKTWIARLQPTRQWLSAIVAASAGLAYLILWEEGTPPAIESWIDEGSGKEQPDAHIETLTMRQFGEDGRLQFELTSPRATHFRHDDSTHFETPEVHYFDDTSRWRSTSRDGVMSNIHNTVLLEHDVVLQQLEKSATLTTELLWIFIDKKVALTNQIVTMKTDGGTLQGTGLAADFNQQTLKLLSNVQGIYEKPRR